MAPENQVIINWYKGKVIVDNGGVLSRSLVELRSLRHTEELTQYEIYERLPKIIRKQQRYREVFRGPLPATALPPETGRYHSRAKWELPSSDKSDGRRRFIARAAESVSAEIESAEMIIGSRKDGKTTDINVGGEAKLQWLQLRLPSLFHRTASSTVEYIIHPPRDPLVQVRILQGDDVREHLMVLESEWTEDPSERSSDRSLSDDIADYFRDRPARDAILTFEIGPSTPLIMSVEIGSSDDLRGVLCLEVRDLEAGTRTTTDPRFLTSVEGKIIASDLPPGLLSDDALDLLRALYDFHGDQRELARSMQIDSEDLRSRLASAVNEFGTSSIDDAIVLSSINSA